MFSGSGSATSSTAPARPPQPDQAILVEGGRIVDVGPDARVARPEHARQLDYPTATALPGPDRRPRPPGHPALARLDARRHARPLRRRAGRARRGVGGTVPARRRHHDLRLRRAWRHGVPDPRRREPRPGPRAANPRQRPADHAHRRPLLVVGRRGRQRRRRPRGRDQAPRRGGRRRHQDDGHRRLHDHDDEPLGVGLSARGVRGCRRGGPQSRALHHRACPRRRRHASRVRGRHRLSPARVDDRARPELAVLRGGRPGHGRARHTCRDDDGPGHPRRPREGRGRSTGGRPGAAIR